MAIFKYYKNMRVSACRVLSFFLIIFFIARAASSQVIPLPHAYAHNDYWHKHPLFDALNNGFTHIEADIYLRHSSLIVAHVFPMFKKHHTLESLYLNPLYDRIINHKDHIQTSMDTIVLMIDIKSNAEKTYQELTNLLKHLKPILSSCENGKVVIRNLTVVLTGHFPLQLLKTEECRVVFVDEDLRKVNAKDSCLNMYTIASCKYSSLITWKGKGHISAFEKGRLNDLVLKAHALGEKVRLWASPENERVWGQLRNCGVDLINTDKLVALKRFFINDLSSN
jgi:hypothetical protein